MSDLSLDDRLAELRRRQSPCRLCPRQCLAKRDKGQLGYCRVPSQLVIADSGPHFGEENVLVGLGGSGTVFLAGCNLMCVFCQNWEISHRAAGRSWAVEDLVYAMLRLAGGGCENINFVTPTHYAPQIAEAIVEARRRGLRVPIIYNCGGYEDVEVLGLLEGLIDVYMPDFKFWAAASAERFCQAADYRDRACAAIHEMHRQVGDLVIDDEIARRGLLVRHLVMPEGLDEGRAILDFLARDVSPKTFVNVMGQYRPCFRAEGYPELDHPCDPTDILELKAHARRLGLRVAE
ncbi:MAG: radical SAM protein [Planctomycetes bacterium]|nr:radical SAM protein [Planctomycetota bacterium]